MIEDGIFPPAPITHIFAGKAAPEYVDAKLIIKLINSLAQVINNDAVVNGHIRVVFLPDYRVSLAEQIIPAADISEQISTAGMEASGTGNMKLAMNGAVTLGTLDGANIEIREEVGAENMYIFGLDSDEVHALRSMHSYDPWRYYSENPAVRRVVDSLIGDMFNFEAQDLFRPLYDRLLSPADPYLHLADLASYIDAKRRILLDYGDPMAWTRKSILNTARTSKFSSDRTVREYAQEIWDLKPYPES